MKRGWKIFGFLMFVLILAVAIYFTIFFHYTCFDLACYQAHQEKCSRTEFIKNLDDATWIYNIKKKSGNDCLVDVKILQIKQGTLDKQSLEGKSMMCSVSFGSMVSPELNLKECHGLLKEEIQELIIQQSHKYILDNLGEIASELDKIV